MARPDQYLNEREYEVFAVGCLLGEASAQGELYENYCNHSYSYSLPIVDEYAPTMASTTTFIVHLRAEARQTSELRLSNPALRGWPFGHLLRQPQPQKSGQT